MRVPTDRAHRRLAAALVAVSALALAATGTATLRPDRAADAGRLHQSPSRPALAPPSRPTPRLARSAARPRPAEVTVVLARAPRVELDRLAAGEARVGAALAGARFSMIDATSARGRTRLARLGVSATPTVILVQPGLPPLRLEGFADRDAIAEAARVARWR